MQRRSHVVPGHPTRLESGGETKAERLQVPDSEAAQAAREEDRVGRDRENGRVGW